MSASNADYNTVLQQWVAAKAARPATGAKGDESGIERPDQWRSLLSLGYRVGQGFHLAVPMPAERVPEFLSGMSQAGDGDWERSVEGAKLPAQIVGEVIDAIVDDGTPLLYYRRGYHELK